jgi:hypothetical protein
MLTLHLKECAGAAVLNMTMDASSRAVCGRRQVQKDFVCWAPPPGTGPQCEEYLTCCLHLHPCAIRCRIDWMGRVVKCTSGALCLDRRVHMFIAHLCCWRGARVQAVHIQALYDSNASNLKAWLLKCPRNQITTLDTHDGIGVVDVAGLMTAKQTKRTWERIQKNGGQPTMRYSAQGGEPDVYQVLFSPELLARLQRAAACALATARRCVGTGTLP